MFNVLVYYVKDGQVQSKNYTEIADDKCTAIDKALLDCTKEFNIDIDDACADIDEIEEVYFLA